VEKVHQIPKESIQYKELKLKNLPSYEQFNEQYLPYFGVKQALDDAKENDGKKTKLSDFHRLYAMSPTWWTAWRKENAEKGYQIKQDAFTKTYEISKDGTVLFVYDYGRYKIFTNEAPSIFILKQEISPEDLEKFKEVDVEDPDAKKETGEEKADKAGEKEAASDEEDSEEDDEFKI
jgi:hypothetical protein